MGRAKHMTLPVLVALMILIPVSTPAEEGSSGHYMPGGIASFIDTLPGKPSLAIANFFSY